MAEERIYRALTLLYPQHFRDHYRDDLAQAHADLVHQRGRSRAWCRSGLDLLITVPRYRLETIMNPRHSDTVILLVIGTLIAIAALATTDVGALFGIIPLALAGLIALTQRSSLARALRTPDSRRRRRRLTTAAKLGVFSLAILVVFRLDVYNDDSWGGRAIVYASVFHVALVAAIVYLVAGLLTPSSTKTSPGSPVVNG